MRACVAIGAVAVSRMGFRRERDGGGRRAVMAVRLTPAESAAVRAAAAACGVDPSDFMRHALLAAAESVRRRATDSPERA